MHAFQKVQFGERVVGFRVGGVRKLVLTILSMGAIQKRKKNRTNPPTWSSCTTSAWI